MLIDSKTYQAGRLLEGKTRGEIEKADKGLKKSLTKKSFESILCIRFEEITSLLIEYKKNFQSLFEVGNESLKKKLDKAFKINIIKSLLSLVL